MLKFQDHILTLPLKNVNILIYKQKKLTEKKQGFAASA